MDFAINDLINIEETLVINLCCTQFRAKVPKRFSLTVIGGVITIPTVLTRNPASTLLSSMIPHPIVSTTVYHLSSISLPFSRIACISFLSHFLGFS